LVRADKSFLLWYPASALYVAAAYSLHLYDPIKRGDVYHHPGAAA
jgi:hypothetical protein